MIELSIGNKEQTRHIDNVTLYSFNGTHTCLTCDRLHIQFNNLNTFNGTHLQLRS